jgi:hypothetical protein
MATPGKPFPVDTSPTKDVVVTGLTKDATVEACILDLLDNSVDAARNSAMRIAGTIEAPQSYDGYQITITFSGTELRIADNCGGISVKQLQSDVMRFGKRSGHYHGIGAFGVGLNRAIFKLGHEALIATDTGKERSQLILKTEDYLRELDKWEITARQFPSTGEVGTTIEISRLPEDIAHQFADKGWVGTRREEIGRVYGRFIEKGLVIDVNGIEAKSLEVPIRENGPYEIEHRFYKTDHGVSIYISYGQHRDHRFTKEKGYDIDKNRKLTDQFGWNVLCNDRAILTCDTSDKTGWDDFHSEYYGFVGSVNFECADPSKLPWNTTKSGVDLNNPAYRMALGGMRAFVRKWKSIADKRKRETPPKPIPPKKGKEVKGSASRSRTKRAKAKIVIKPKPVEKPDHHEFRTILPADVDERYCFDKHLKVVHEAKELDLGDAAYTGMALMRMLFEFSVAAYLVRHGKYEDLRQFAIQRRRSRGVKIEPADERKVNPAVEEIIPYLDNNPSVWGAKENYLRHSLKKMGAHVATLNTALHNPFQPVERSKAFEIREEILPMVRHLIETKQEGS